MGAQIRVYRQKIASTSSLRKMFKAMELIATSRIGKARSRMASSQPYADAITRAVSAVSSQHEIVHPLTLEREHIRRAALVTFTADRGQAGAYSASIIRRSEELVELLTQTGREVRNYVVGRKGQNYFDFRQRPYENVWTGNTDNPDFETAQEIGRVLLEQFIAGADGGGVDEIHLVYTRFRSMVSQEPTVVRLLPLEVVEEAAPAENLLPLYEYEPEPEAVLDALLPRYIESRIFAAMLQAAASELAARQRAMKSAADNATELIEKYTRLRNTARQAEITQELTEIIAGANALNAPSR